MDLATICDAGQRGTRAGRDQLAATGGPEAVTEAAWKQGWPSRDEIAENYRAWVAEERAQRNGVRGERGLSGAPPADTPRAATLAAVRSVVVATTSALSERFRELRDIAPATEPARLLMTARRLLRPRARRTPPTAFRTAFMLPETPSPAEMTIIETPFRIPRYMDHPEWRPC